MAEQAGGIKSEPVKKPSTSISRRNFSKGAAAGVGLAMVGVNPVRADNTPTPNVIATEKASLQTAVAAQQTRVVEQTEVANLKKTATALSSSPTETSTVTPSATPTEKPSPTITPTSTNSPTVSPTVDTAATVQAQAVMDEASAKYRGSLQATATEVVKQQEAVKAQKTASATPPTPTPTNIPEDNPEEELTTPANNIPVEKEALGAAAVTLGVAIPAAIKFRRGIGRTLGSLINKLPGRRGP